MLLSERVALLARADDANARAELVQKLAAADVLKRRHAAYLTYTERVAASATTQARTMDAHLEDARRRYHAARQGHDDVYRAHHEATQPVAREVKAALERFLPIVEALGSGADEALLCLPASLQVSTGLRVTYTTPYVHILGPNGDPLTDWEFGPYDVTVADNSRSWGSELHIKIDRGDNFNERYVDSSDRDDVDIAEYPDDDDTSYSIGQPHPHINTEGEPCLGNAAELIKSALSDGDLFGVLSTVANFLRHYNKGNPYRRLELWIPDNPYDNPSCSGCGNTTASCACYDVCNDPMFRPVLLCSHCRNEVPLRTCGSCVACCARHHVFDPAAAAIGAGLRGSSCALRLARPSPQLATFQP